jgi:hypothetical protein
MEALLESVDNDAPLLVRPCDMQKSADLLKLRKAFGIGRIYS